MVTVDELKAVLEAVLPDEFKGLDITAESDLKKDIGLNSIGMLYTAMVLEEKYNIKFSNEDLTSINTVADVIAKIEGKA